MGLFESRPYKLDMLSKEEREAVLWAINTAIGWGFQSDEDLVNLKSAQKHINGRALTSKEWVMAATSISAVLLSLKSTDETGMRAAALKEKKILQEQLLSAQKKLG